MSKTSQPNISPADSAALLDALLATPIGSPEHGYGQQEAHLLLQTLLATPLPDQPIRGRDTLWRAVARNGRRDWLDGALALTQRALLAASALALGTWAALGPVGNWLHASNTSPRLAVVAQQPTVALPVLVQRARFAAAVPSRGSSVGVVPTTVAPHIDAAQNDFLVPSQMRGVAQAVDQSPQPSRLLLPTIGVDTPVVEVFLVDGEWEVAHYAAGYLHGSGLPGDANNMVLAGHAGLFGGVFADLHDLKANDDVYVDAAGWRYHYRVRKSLVVWPTETEYLLPTDIPTLTLITCTNWDRQSIVVMADLVDTRPL